MSYVFRPGTDVDPDHIGEEHARHGEPYAHGDRTGTAHIPTANNTRHGIAVDHTTGTCYVPTAANTRYGIQVDHTTGSMTMGGVADWSSYVAFFNVDDVWLEDIGNIFHEDVDTLYFSLPNGVRDLYLWGVGEDIRKVGVEPQSWNNGPGPFRTGEWRHLVTAAMELRELDLSQMDITNCTFWAFDSNSSLSDIDLPFGEWPTTIYGDGCDLLQEDVDAILAKCVADGKENGSLYLDGGTNAAPSAAGDTDAATLVGRGWDVYTN